MVPEAKFHLGIDSRLYLPDNEQRDLLIWKKPTPKGPPMKRLTVLLLVVFAFFGGPARSQEVGGGEAPLPKEEILDEILLKDGNIIRGQILEETDEMVIIQTPSMGRMEISRDNIQRVAKSDATSGVFSDPDINTIMFCPTPATLPKGDAYFRDFELFILNFGWGVTDDLDLSMGTLFPISTDVLMLSVGVKYQLVNRDESPMGLALTAGYTFLEETRFGSFGGVAGIGNSQKSLNLAVNYTYDEDGDGETIYLVGGDIQMGRRNKLFAEYFNSETLLLDESDDLKGFINIGMRFFGQRHSFSLSGFRPLAQDSGSFIAFPMIMYSHHF